MPIMRSPQKGSARCVLLAVLAQSRPPRGPEGREQRATAQNAGAARVPGSATMADRAAGDNGNATGQPAAARSTARGHTARVGRQVRISDDAVGDAGPSRAARRRTRRIPGVFLAKQQQCFGA
ncbi:unnamed protein product [Ixodes pacificus]